MKTQQSSASSFYGYQSMLTLSLRSLELTHLETLSAASDQYECIDVSDNQIDYVAGFPLLKKLKVLILAFNRLTAIDGYALKNLPNLEVLILTGNRISSVEGISGIQHCKRLKRISLVNNPISSFPAYRRQLLKLQPSLEYIDFKRLDQGEREVEDSKRTSEDQETMNEEIKALIEAAKTDEEIEVVRQYIESLRK
jgi:U2 small nuclear ribonucleoprotein A'